MGWPTPQEYNEAIQNPAQNLADDELRQGSVALDGIGLPKVASGNFASVYQVRCGGRSIAVRCFLHDVSDQALRYEKITGFVMNDDLPHTVTFQYLQQGILVYGGWFPILKMQWVEGQPLDQYVKTHVQDQSRMSVLAEHFKNMVLDLQKTGIAHGDLQHGNILVMENGSDLRLVDYDNMFVPALEGAQSHELGHRNYQHPSRNTYDFGVHLDNFAAWSIYTSLVCLSLDPGLVSTPGACDESMLFRYEDYKSPLSSGTFAVLENHANAKIRGAARKFRSLLRLSLKELPALDADVQVPPDLTPLSVIPHFAVNANLPAWMLAPDAVTLPTVDDADEASDASSNEPWKAPKIGAAELWSCPTAEQYLAALKEPRESLCRFPDLVDAVFPHNRGVVQHIATEDSLVCPVFLTTSAMAVKMYLNPDPERSKRFRILQNLKSVTPELEAFLIPVEYYESGIRVMGVWYPVLIMPWLGGVTLRQVMKQTKSVRQLAEWAKQLRLLMEALEENSLVHGDIEPGNLMVVGSHLKLLDYDALRAAGSSFSHPLPSENYRHPGISAKSVGVNDNFSAWILDTALTCLAASESLREMQKPSGDLFTAEDFRDPGRSPLFRWMQADSDPLVKNRARLIEAMLHDEPEEAPPLKPDVGVERAYATHHSLGFHGVSRYRVSPDMRAPITRLTAPTPKPVQEPVGDALPAVRSQTAVVERKGSDVPFLAIVIAALMMAIMLAAVLISRVVH